MPQFTPLDPNFQTRIRERFARGGLMQTLGASMEKTMPGEVHLAMPFNPLWTQQHGYLHAGIITSLVDTACGYATYTLIEPESGVLTVEFKVNFLRPGRGEKFIAVGRVLKFGRTLTVCQGEVTAYENGQENLIAAMQATMMVVDL